MFMVEHHFTGQGQVSASMTLLAYLAAKTQKIRLGTAVVVLPWHNPVLVAEQAATLDLLSGGRFDFGVGKGYRQAEFDGFCIPIAEATERFDEAIEIIRKAWTSKGRFSHHGKRWHYDDVVVEPEPLQRPHPPLWLAAGSHDSVRRAARGAAPPARVGRGGAPASRGEPRRRRKKAPPQWKPSTTSSSAPDRPAACSPAG